jgi:hypothetical protein
MSVSNMPTLLRFALIADLAFSAVAAVLLSAVAGPLGGLFALPADFVRAVGLVLVPWCAILILVLAGKLPAVAGTRFVIAANAAWVVASIALLFTGWVAPNALGTAFIVVQAVAVAVFAELQFIGLRRGGAVIA